MSKTSKKGKKADSATDETWLESSIIGKFHCCRTVLLMIIRQNLPCSQSR